MRRLYDVNVLVALLHPDHEHHESAVLWSRSIGAHEWATCEITRAGFLRLSFNAGVVKRAIHPAIALQALERNTCSPNHRFVTFDPGATELLTRILERCQGYKQVTDGFLVHIATTNDARLTTFDRRIQTLSPEPERIEIIPTNSQATNTP